MLIAIVFYSSCTTNTNKKIKSKKQDSIIPPLTVTITEPKRVLINANSTPQAIKVPTKSGSAYIKRVNKIKENIMLLPPAIKKADFFVHMPTYNTDQGLALSGLACGYLAKDGNLWLGTYGGGVSRYDGKSFTNFTTAQGLANILVICITEDAMGNIWFGTDRGGVSKYDGNTFTNFTTAQGLPNNTVRSIIQDKDGNIWFGTDHGGASKYDGKSFTNFTTENGLPNNTVRTILKDKSGNLWFGTEGGVSYYDGKTFTKFNTTQGLAGNIVLSSIEDKAGNVWFGTSEGVSKYDGKTFTTFTTKQGLTHNTVWCIAEDNRGAVWFGTRGGGVSRYDGNAFVNFTMTQGLVNNNITSITKDKTGNMWIGTYGGGICRYDGASIITYTAAQGLPANVVWNIMEDKQGNIWFGTDGGGISRYDGKSFTNFNTSQGLFNNTVWSSAEDKRGNLWFGGNGGGVCCYDGKSLTNFTTEQGLVHDVVKYVYEDRSGTLWFGTDGGLSRYNPPSANAVFGSFTNFTKAQGLSSNAIRCIVEDKKGNLWIGTFGGGVNCYDGKSFTHYTTAQGLANNTVWSITEDKSGNLWFSTFGGGISRYDGKSFVNYTTNQGLADNFATQIVEDAKGKLWIGTNIGVSGLNYKTNELEKGASGFIPGSNALSNEALLKYTPVFDNYNERTGYAIKDVNQGQNAMLIDSKGIIWTATGDDKTSLVRFDPSALNRNFELPSLFIQAVKLNEESICWHDLRYAKMDDTRDTSEINPLGFPATTTEEVTTFGRNLTEAEFNALRKKYTDVHFDGISRFYSIPQQLIIPYNHNNISFDFAAIETAKPFMVRYQYMLEGYDKDWSVISNKTTATFGNMYEGTYTFKLKAQSPEGVWCAPVTYTFKVLPPWYRTWWAYILYAASTFIVLFLGYRTRTRSLRKDKEMLERTVKERTAEVVKQKDDAEKQRLEAEKQKLVIEEKNTELEKLSIVASETANGVLITDANGHLEWFNEGFSKLFGWLSVDDFVEKRGKKIFELSTNDNLGELITKAVREKKSLTYEAINKTKDGRELWIQVTLTPIFDKTGKLKKLVFVDSDITELKKAKETAEKALQIQEQFLANTSHEIRTPMNGVIGMTTQLLETQLSAEQTEYLNAIRESSNNLLHVVNDILDISKIRAGKIVFEKTEFRLADLFKTLQLTMQYRADEKTIFIETHIDESLPPVIIGDPIRLNQVLLNLVGNAIKFTEKGGITILAEKIKTIDNKIGINFCVTDTGIGIPDDKLDYVFESFTQAESHTTRKYGGTGLGLSISKSLIEQQGGHITINSQLGIGSSFSFLLHFTAGDPAWQGSFAKSNQGIPANVDLSNLHILVVDDNKINQRVALFELNKWKVNSDVAADATSALEKIKSKKYDIILMDISMPGMDGLEATRYIRSQLPEPAKSTPIIAMTASAVSGERKNCFDAGMDDYISKPFNPVVLYTKIVKWGNGEDAILVESENHISPKVVTDSNNNKLINLRLLRENTGGDSAFIKEMIHIYMKDMPMYLHDLNTFLQHKNWRKVSSQAHKMKSSAALFGAAHLTGLLTEIEVACKDKLLEKEEEIANKIKRVNVLFHISINELAQEFKDCA